MKNFRNVTIIILTVITLLFAGNVYYLYSLYQSVKEQYISVARDCLMQSDYIETVFRIKRLFPDTYNSHFDLNIRIDPDRRMTESGKITPPFGNVSDSAFAAIAGKENLLGMFQTMHATMAYNIHNRVPEEYSKPDLALLDSIFISELHRVGLYPKRAFVLPADSVDNQNTRGLWCIDYNLFKGHPTVYRAYMTPPLGSMLKQTVGIVVTTFLIIILLAFAFIYLIRTVMKMKSIEEMKDDFTNNMTHELKTPISASYSAIDTLLNCGKHNDAQRREKYLKMALGQLTRLGELVESILSMSMERRKNITLKKESVDVKPFLLEITSIHAERVDKPVNINVEVIPDNLTITTDPSHFGNVMNNLIDNAIKYSGDCVNIQIHVDDAGLSISDNGIGIPAKHLSQIFNRFYRVPNGNRQDVRGYGIGLYYVYSILSKMGWGIDVNSTPGVGSTFFIRFNKNEK